MRISQISLEDNGVVAFNIQRRNRNFTKMLSFIFVRLREKIQIFTDLTNILVMLSVPSLLWFVLSMTKQTFSLFPLLCLSGATSSSLFLLLFHLPQIPWFMLSQTRTTEGINNLHNTLKATRLSLQHSQTIRSLQSKSDVIFAERMLIQWTVVILGHCLSPRPAHHTTAPVTTRTHLKNKSSEQELLRMPAKLL